MMGIYIVISILIIAAATCFCLPAYFYHREVMKYGYPPEELSTETGYTVEDLNQAIDRLQNSLAEKKKTEDALRGVDIFIKGDKAAAICSDRSEQCKCKTKKESGKRED